MGIQRLKIGDWNVRYSIESGQDGLNMLSWTLEKMPES